MRCFEPSRSASIPEPSGWPRRGAPWPALAGEANFLAQLKCRRYSGVSFDARGEGSYRFLAYISGVAARDPHAAPFSAATEWQTVRVPFDDLKRAGSDAALWNPRAVRALAFELSGAPESAVWLELDNVRFY